MSQFPPPPLRKRSAAGVLTSATCLLASVLQAASNCHFYAPSTRASRRGGLEYKPVAHVSARERPEPSAVALCGSIIWKIEITGRARGPAACSAVTYSVMASIIGGYSLTFGKVTMQLVKETGSSGDNQFDRAWTFFVAALFVFCAVTNVHFLNAGLAHCAQAAAMAAAAASASSPGAAPLTHVDSSSSTTTMGSTSSNSGSSSPTEGAGADALLLLSACAEVQRREPPQSSSPQAVAYTPPQAAAMAEAAAPVPDHLLRCIQDDAQQPQPSAAPPPPTYESVLAVPQTCSPVMLVAS